MAGDFSDEEWDISDDQWQVLEHNAITLTQQQQQGARPGRKPVTTNGRNPSRTSTERLDSSSLRRTALGTPATQNGNRVVSEEDSFDNPQLDEDGVPLVLEVQPQPYVVRRPVDESIQREQWRANRYAQKHGPQPQPRPIQRTIPHHAYQEHQQKQASQNGRVVQPQVQQQLRQAAYPAGPPSQSTQGFHIIPKPNQATDPFQAELEQLRKEKEALSHSLNQVQSELFTAKGEISVIRSKNDNDIRTAERQVAILKKQMQEEAVKHDTVLRSKDASYAQLATDSKFLKHELNEQTRKVQALQIRTKEQPLQARPNDANLSPRRGIVSNLRDGFDDNEVMQLSPGRGRSPAGHRTSKPNTPNKKRKHTTANTIDMPSLTLRLSGDGHEQLQNKQPAKDEPPAQIARDHQSEYNLNLLKDLFAFRPRMSQDTVVESLTKFSFPSDKNRPLSSILLTETSNLKQPRFAGDLLDIFTSFVARCWREEYYIPLGILLEAIGHILDLEPIVVDQEVIKSLVPPLQEIIAVNGKIRWKLADMNQVWNDANPKPKVKPEINVAACLDVLIMLAGLVVDDYVLIREFWGCLTTEIILIMLAPCQPIPDLALMLELMTTSVLPESFGNICGEDQQQNQTEIYHVDKICYLLHNPPRVVMKHIQDQLAKQKKQRFSTNKDIEVPDPPPTRLQICHFRFKALDLISKIAMTSIPHPHQSGIDSHHGTSLLLFHPSAVARLTRLLYDEVSNLYDAHTDTHHLHAQLINRATAILHHLLLSPQAISRDSKFDLTKAVSAVLAGVNRFRVALSRIIFREALEHGIDTPITEDTVQRANEILEEYVTPDEAVQLLAAFGKDVVDEDEEMADEDAEAEAAVMAEVL
ncbi:hypothetical protein LTR64_000566 [Lithohypha guttulata]|uniref:uncharacterized protein n=1 Tax=Lithohypha guttulata TaxID=1690604 RepID=UPI00315C52B2